VDGQLVFGKNGGFYLQRLHLSVPRGRKEGREGGGEVNAGQTAKPDFDKTTVFDIRYFRKGCQKERNEERGGKEGRKECQEGRMSERTEGG
jgi:hypothetical protein